MTRKALILAGSFVVSMTAVVAGATGYISQPYAMFVILAMYVSLRILFS